MVSTTAARSTTTRKSRSGPLAGFITHLQEMTGKRLKGRSAAVPATPSERTILMAEAGCLYHTSWIIDDQPWPITCGAARNSSMWLTPARPTTPAVGMESRSRLLPADDQGPVRHALREARKTARDVSVAASAQHRASACRKHLDEALRYISAMTACGTPRPTTSPSITSPTTTTRCHPGSPNAKASNKRSDQRASTRRAAGHRPLTAMHSISTRFTSSQYVTNGVSS